MKVWCVFLKKDKRRVCVVTRERESVLLIELTLTTFSIAIKSVFFVFNCIKSVLFVFN
jgi:hypothetical protein